MITNCYAIFDNKATAFLQPAMMANDEVAKRSFAMACRNENDPFVEFADDYTIYHIAEYDDSNGQYTNLDMPKPIINAREARLMLPSQIEEN